MIFEYKTLSKWLNFTTYIVGSSVFNKKKICDFYGYFLMVFMLIIEIKMINVVRIHLKKTAGAEKKDEKKDEEIADFEKEE